MSLTTIKIQKTTLHKIQVAKAIGQHKTMDALIIYLLNLDKFSKTYEATETATEEK